MPFGLIEQEDQADAMGGTELIERIRAQIRVVDLEFADRHSRAGAPHLHVVIAAPDGEEVFVLIFEAFMEIAGYRSGCQLRGRAPVLETEVEIGGGQEAVIAVRRDIP